MELFKGGVVVVGMRRVVLGVVLLIGCRSAAPRPQESPSIDELLARLESVTWTMKSGEQLAGEEAQRVAPVEETPSDAPPPAYLMHERREALVEPLPDPTIAAQGPAVLHGQREGVLSVFARVSDPEAHAMQSRVEALRDAIGMCLQPDLQRTACRRGVALIYSVGARQEARLVGVQGTTSEAGLRCVERQLQAGRLRLVAPSGPVEVRIVAAYRPAEAEVCPDQAGSPR